MEETRCYQRCPLNLRDHLLIVYLDYGCIVQEAKVTTTKHGVGAVGRVVAHAALARVQLIVDDGHLEKGRITTDGQTEQDGLCGRKHENEQKHPIGRITRSAKRCLRKKKEKKRKLATTVT